MAAAVRIIRVRSVSRTKNLLKGKNERVEMKWEKKKSMNKKKKKKKKKKIDKLGPGEHSEETNGKNNDRKKQKGGDFENNIFSQGVIAKAFNGPHKAEYNSEDTKNTQNGTC